MSLLQLPSFKEIELLQENDTDMLFKVELSSPPKRCKNCGFNNLYEYPIFLKQYNENKI